MSGADDSSPEPAESLRQRKKRLTRQLISDTATRMFLARGFDAVRVSDVADACAVSEKTVYNYFATKEALLLDREESMAASIQREFGPGAPPRSPIDSALRVIAQDLQDVRSRLRQDGSGTLPSFQRFTELVDSTPSLRAAERDMMERLVQVAARAMASRAEVSPDDPEPQIAAHAILGLWRVQYQAMGRYANGQRSADEVHDLVMDEVRRAGRLIESGLWSFGIMVQGRGSKEQLAAAADAALMAGRQITTALRRARTAWHQLQSEHHEAHDSLRARVVEGHRRPHHR